MKAFLSQVGARSNSDGPRRSFGGPLWDEIADRELRRVLREVERGNEVTTLQSRRLAEAIAARLKEGAFDA